MKKLFLFLFLMANVASAIEVSHVDADLSKVPLKGSVFKGAVEANVTLMGQPMIIPKPKATRTSNIKVKAVHNGSWVAFQMKWKCPKKSEAGKIGAFSDAVALQFPVKNNKAPPPVFMGMQGNPVHIYHWRAQFQVDRDKGMKQVKDIYPNSNVDVYPMEFRDEGKIKGLTDEKREVYSAGRAAGNPQSYAKTKGFDEIMAEGFSSSVVRKDIEGSADGKWENGEWTVVIARPLKRKEGSTLKAGESTFTAFAVWQGSDGEVGSRKSVTMSWIPLNLAAMPNSKVALSSNAEAGK